MQEKTDWQSFCKFPRYVNFEFGPIGKAMSTKVNPNTAAEFHFWLAEGNDAVELGNIVACVTDNGHVTLGSTV